MTTRRGAGLLELLVLIASLGTMLVVVASLMHRMIGLDRAERSRLVVASTIERLGRDLRADARSAVGPAERADARLVLPGPDGRSIVWIVREAEITRTVNRAGKVEGVEVYALLRNTRASFEPPSKETPTRIALRFRLDAKKPGDPGYDGYRIEAMTGRDLALKGVSP